MCIMMAIMHMIHYMNVISKSILDRFLLRTMFLGKKGNWLMIICDPIHMLKRARYRLLKGNIICNFNASSKMVNAKKYKTVKYC